MKIRCNSFEQAERFPDMNSETLKKEVVDWFESNNIKYEMQYGDYRIDLIIEDDKHCMLFKLTWL